MNRHPITILTVILVAIIFMFSLSACGNTAKPNELNWEVEDFTFTNQYQEKLGLSDLKGEVWLADFIFTNCNTVCPPMTANMSQVQSTLKEAGLMVPIVSFSVDPSNDTPQALKEFGEKFNADFTTWHFLTGYSDEEIQAFGFNSFKVAIQKETDTDQVIHGTSFYLVDQSGTIVKKYDGLSTPFDEIVQDVKALRR